MYFRILVGKFFLGKLKFMIYSLLAWKCLGVFYSLYALRKAVLSRGLTLTLIALSAAVAVILVLLGPTDAHALTSNSATYHDVRLGEKWNIPVDEKHSYPQHGIRIKRSKEEDDCRQEVDKKFIGFTRTLRATGSKYQELFKNIGSLKCIYVSMKAHLQPYQTSKMEFFCENRQQFLAVNYFRIQLYLRSLTRL